MKFKLLIPLAILLVSLATKVDAVCKSCGSHSGVMCLTYNTFQFCTNGMASGSTFTCPSNTACSNTPDICASPSTIPADCPTSCGTCSADGRFACIDSTTYALCFGSTTPSTSYTASCPTNQYCDITSTAPSFCSTDSTKSCGSTSTTSTTVSTASTASTASTTSTASTATTATTTISTTTIATTTATATTTAAATTTTTPAPSNYCASIHARDKTRYAAPFPTNCSQYVYCYVNSSNLYGRYYTCPGSTLFNNVTGYCVNSASYTCPSGF